MEGFQWIRISTIVALFLGAIYVLLPTILQQDSDELLGDKADSVQTTQLAPDLKLKFSVEDGNVDDAFSAVEARLAGHVGVERVQREDNVIVVVVRVGAEPEDIAAELQESHTVTLTALGGQE